MRRVALRGLLARKTRLALTSLAVALGVTLIAGTYVFTDTINASFDRIFAAAYRGTDVVVTPNDDLGGDGTPPVPAALAQRIRGVDGVATVEGGIFDAGGTFLTKAGKPFGAQGPKFVVSAHAVERFGGFSYADGRAPRTPDEVALDKASADREGFGVGDRLTVQAETPKKAYRVVGLARAAGADSYGGAAFALLTLPEAQRVTGKPGGFDEIDVAVDKDASAGAVAAAVRAVVPPGRVEVRTGAQQADDQSRSIRDDLGFLTTALLAFAGISVFVGAFLIFNTSSITVAQRAREFALLRTLGASRGQVLRAVLAEGLAVGVLGSLAGLGLGILVAQGLKALLQAFGLDLPSSGITFQARTAVVALTVGTVVTVLATLAPALRATRVPPVAALREGVALPETRASRLAFPAALGLTALGVALMVAGLFLDVSDDGALALVGAGAAVSFLGVALLSPRLVGPLAAVVGRPIEARFGITGRLARENTVRQPGRTAVTAAALMVGVALVAFATIFASGARATIDDAIDSGLRGQAVLQSQDGFTPFADGAARRVAQVPGVARVGVLRFAEGRVAGEKTDVSGVDDAFRALYRVDLPPLSAGTVVVSQGWAEDHGTRAGDTLTIRTPTTDALRLRVVGTVQDEGKLLSDLTVGADVVARDFGQRKDGLAVVGYAPGSDPKRAIDAALTGAFPAVEALTAQEFKDDAGARVTQLLGLIYALLALAILVSLFGIVNTLVLSITERTRELGMLRAIGTSRRQVRRLIRYEAVITALIGAVIGLAVGIVLSLLVSRAIDDFALSIPVVSLALVVLAAGIAGVVAAILPARRAARLDVLRALAYE